MDPLQYVYLLQEREFVNNGEPVYKIEKTKQAKPEEEEDEEDDEEEEEDDE